MDAERLSQNWRAMTAEILTGLAEWRQQHPKATLREIETALDERWAVARAHILREAALASAAADLGRPTERPACPACGGRMEARGMGERTLTTHGDQPVALRRSRAVCPARGAGFPPLDEELGLLPSPLTPRLVERVARRGAWAPFAPAAGMLASFTGVHVSEATVRRLTARAGAVHVDLQTAAAERLEREAPPAPAGPAVQQVSVDGAMAPLVGGEWAEVKTLAIGAVTAPGRAERFSYFSRLADAETFTRLATVETHRRGTETAGVVCAVADGAERAQGVVDHHRPDAVRILDFPHAAGYLATAARALFGPETPGGAAWLAARRHALRHGDPARAAGKLRGLRDDLARAAGGRRPATVAALTAGLPYLEKRLPQLRYAEFAAAGYPLGSGSVESANKLVVEARLKGSGMHWARAHINPLVAVRTVVCSDRWGAIPFK